MNRTDSRDAEQSHSAEDSRRNGQADEERKADNEPSSGAYEELGSPEGETGRGFVIGPVEGGSDVQRDGLPLTDRF